MADLDINIDSQIVVKTAAQWVVDTGVYSAKRFLITSDLFYIGTNQPRFKLANGTDVWSDLDYVPSAISKFVSKNADYTLTIEDRTVECITNSSIQTLPTAVGKAGKLYRIINTTGVNVIVDTTSSQEIGNKPSGNPTSITLLSEEWLDVISNGANWRIV